MADRIRVTSSRRSPVRRSVPSMGSELREQTGLGDVYLRGLMAAQLRLSAMVLLVGVMLLGGLPIVFALVPDTRDVSVAGIPLPWLLLGVVVYPAAVVTAQFYVRASERIERQFREVAAAAPPADGAPTSLAEGSPADGSPAQDPPS